MEAAMQSNLDKEWVKEWNKYSIDRPYSKIFELNIHGFTSNMKPRHMETTINRLRLHCCGLGLYLKKLNLRDSDLCTTCNKTEDVSHFLLECLNHSELHKDLKNVLEKNKLTFNVENCLTVDLCQRTIYKYIIKNELKI